MDEATRTKLIDMLEEVSNAGYRVADSMETGCSADVRDAQAQNDARLAEVLTFVESLLKDKS